MFEVAFSRRMCCSRVCSVSTKPRCRRRPSSPPRCGRACGAGRPAAAAKKPNDGPPKSSRLPSGWPSPTAMSTPKSPGGRRTPSVIGSTWTISSAPVSLAIGASASRSSTAPRKFGWARNTAAMSSPIAARSASASVTPSASATSSMVVPQPAPVVASVSRECGCTPRETTKRRAAGVDLGEVAGGGERARALVDARVGDRQPGELGDHRLVLEHHLQPALGDLGLVRRVRRQELRARRDAVHQRRDVVVVHPGAEERQLVLGGDVARGERRAGSRRPPARACRRAGPAGGRGAGPRGCRRRGRRRWRPRSRRASPGGRRRSRRCSGSRCIKLARGAAYLAPSPRARLHPCCAPVAG